MNRHILPVILLFYLSISLPSEAITIHVVHPKQADDIATPRSSTFVIGTVEPADSFVTCNGVRCDVKSDGSFIGYAPVIPLPEENWIRKENKVCDGYFEFIARRGADEEKIKVPVYSSRSPSTTILPQLVFDPPRTIRINKDRIYALEGEQLGNIIFVAKDTLLQTPYGNASNFVCKTTLNHEFSVSRSDADSADDKPVRNYTTPWELVIPNQSTITSRGNPQPLSSTNSLLWGLHINTDPDKVNFIPRLQIRGDRKPISTDQPMKGIRICLDPGHNPDPGAIGPRGFEERRSTLLLGYALAENLVLQGATVEFTHTEEPLLLSLRHDRIRELKPDILISLHNNSVGDDRDPRARHGTETYYLYPWSKPLAEAVHAEMIRCLGSRDLGCIKRNLYITRFPDCPAILVEPEYLILPDVESNFMDQQERARLADAIATGIKNFLINSLDR